MRNTIAVGEVKKAIVVGATSGIGREIAKRLLAEGYTIGVAGRRTEELERLRALDYDRVFTSVIDVNVDDSINKLHQLIADMGGMNLFVLTSAEWRAPRASVFRDDAAAWRAGAAGRCRDHPQQQAAEKEIE